MGRMKAFLALAAAPTALLLGWLIGFGLRSLIGVGIMVLGASVAIGLAYGARGSRGKRQRLQQAWIFATLLVSFFLGYVGLIILASALFAGPDSGTEVENLEHGRSVGVLCLLLWSGVVIGTQAKKVDYRWGDVFMLFIPFFGPLVFLPKLLWRIAGLPNRPWVTSSTSTVALSSSDAQLASSAPAPTSSLPPRPDGWSAIEEAPPPPSAAAPIVELNGRPLMRPRPPWLVPTVGLLTAIAIGLTSVVVMSSQAGSKNADDERRPARASSQALPPEPEEVEEPELRVTGTLFLPSPSAREKPLFDLTVCRNADRVEGARLEAQSARLSFSSDQDGGTILGATGTQGAGELVFTTVDGEPMCGWKVSFSAQLPPDTTAFFVQFGYTDDYWGPFSSAEGRKGSSLARANG